MLCRAPSPDSFLRWLSGSRRGAENDTRDACAPQNKIARLVKIRAGNRQSAPLPFALLKRSGVDYRERPMLELKLIVPGQLSGPPKSAGCPFSSNAISSPKASRRRRLIKLIAR